MSDKKVLMPESLTAENGAKALLIGEFWATAPNGAKVMIDWATIKEIYATAVNHLGQEQDQ